ncbi:MAG: hypothetical protein IJR13_06780 [Bacteroidales bacterium]|nr:hypothetical protein [Bacteroidales bacterium]
MRINIYMACPGCRKSYGHAASEYWTHGDGCGGVLQLDEYANVWCARCGEHAHLTEMTLSCNSGRHRFYVPSTTGFAEAITTSAQMVNSSGIRWLQNVLRYL